MPLDRPLALPQGAPAGIGPDITLSAWMRRNETALPPFLLVADPSVIRARAVLLGLDIPIAEADPANAIDTFSRDLPDIPVAAGTDVAAGRPHEATPQAHTPPSNTHAPLTIEANTTP